MTSILIKNAYVITVDANRRIFENGGIAIDLVDINNATASVEFANVSPINGQINITIQTNNTWMLLLVIKNS